MKSHLVLSQIPLSLKIAEGKPALLPTDTVVALAALPNYASQLWQLKQRPQDKPLILMGATTHALLRHVHSCAFTDAQRMANSYWPGALTLVLPASGEVVDALNPGSLSIGLRVPACEQTRELLIKTGPLATTSANITGNKSSTCAEEAAAIFPQIPMLGPVPWPPSSGLASTVLAWEKGSNWKVLRQGLVKVS